MKINGKMEIKKNLMQRGKYMRILRNTSKLISFLMCYILIAAALPINVMAQSSSGSTVINNNSLLVKEGDWLYYRNSADGGSIYKIKTDGTENTKVNNISSCDISLQGDWIYFKTLVPSSSDKNYEMFRIKKSDANAVPEDLGFISNSEAFIGDYIYYVKNRDGVYKVKADNSEKPKKIVDCIHGGIRKNYIFYEKSVNDGNSLGTYFVADLDGRNQRQVGTTNDIVKFTDDWIYYQEDSGDKDALYRMKVDGSEKSLVDEEAAAYLTYVLNDDWIYNDKYGIKKVDGSKKIKESGVLFPFKSYTGDVWTGAKMVDNWVYFNDTNYNCLSLVNTDNGEKIKLYNNSTDKIINQNVLDPSSCLKDDNYLYYINEANDGEMLLYKYNINSADVQKLSPYEEIQKVSDNKQWVVKFKKAVAPSSINDKTVLVTDGDNNPVNVLITVNPDGKSITIKKANANGTWEKYRILSDYFTCGKQIYNLRITKAVKDIDGKTLSNDVIKQFEIK